MKCGKHYFIYKYKEIVLHTELVCFTGEHQWEMQMDIKYLLHICICMHISKKKYKNVVFNEPKINKQPLINCKYTTLLTASAKRIIWLCYWESCWSGNESITNNNRGNPLLLWKILFTMFWKHKQSGNNVNRERLQ